MSDRPSLEAAHCGNRGSELLKELIYDDALAYFDAALIKDPKNPVIWNLKGRAHAGNREFSEALYCYGVATTIDPKFAECYNDLGCMLDDEGRNLDHEHSPGKVVLPPIEAALKYSAAIVFFNKAISIKKEYADAWNNKAISLFYLGRLQEALKCVNRAIEIDSGFKDAIINQGIIYEELEELEKSNESFGKARDLGIKLSTKHE